MGRVSLDRPRSIAGIAQHAKGDRSAFDRLVREFLDAWQGMSNLERSAALAEAPAPIGQPQNAYLAALAEHLALDCRLAVPEWTEGHERFLEAPFFAGGLESLKATLLAQSPLAFRRRLIFISADALTRPPRREKQSIVSPSV
jgi:hypothetical protein